MQDTTLDLFSAPAEPIAGGAAIAPPVEPAAPQSPAAPRRKSTGRKSTGGRRRNRSGRSGPKAPAMTAEDARHFDRFSVQNAVIVESVAAERGCDCKAYADWYTFRRWKALGRSVKKGETSTRVPVVIERHDDDSGETVRSFRNIPLFCRCQTKASGARAGA